MIKHLRSLTVLLSLIVMMSTQAQENIDLAQQYEDTVFSLDYPDNWEILAEDTVDGERIVFSASATNSDSDTEGRIVLSLIENNDDSALEWAEDSADEVDDRLHDVGLVIEFELNGLDGAFVDILGDTSRRFFALRLNDEILVDIVITAETNHILALSPILYDLLNTLRLNGDDSKIQDLEFGYILSETYERQGSWVFDYPEGWLVEDYDNFTLLSVPNMETTLGVSFNYFPAGTENLDEYVEFLNELFISSSGDVPYEDVPYKFGGISAVLTRYELEGDSGYSSLSASPRDNRVTTVSIFGPKEEIEYFIAIAESIILTIDED